MAAGSCRIGLVRPSARELHGTGLHSHLPAGDASSLTQITQLWAQVRRVPDSSEAHRSRAYPGTTLGLPNQPAGLSPPPSGTPCPPSLVPRHLIPHWHTRRHRREGTVTHLLSSEWGVGQSNYDAESLFLAILLEVLCTQQHNLGSSPSQRRAVSRDPLGRLPSGASLAGSRTLHCRITRISRHR